MLIVTGGLVYLNGKFVDGMDLLIEDKKIKDIVPKGTFTEGQVLDVQGNYVAPGFIDLHMHGCVGCDTMDADVSSLNKMARFLASHGTTSFLPTTMTMGFDDIYKSVEAIAEYMDGDYDGADVIGVHLEGPFINPGAKGAQAEEHIVQPNKSILEQWPDSLMDIVRLVVVAPEMEGAEELIKYLTDKGITVSIAHTKATYDQCIRSVAWGITHATHCYNAMTGLHHREPGVVGAIFYMDDVTIELIADFIHVHPAAVKIAINAKGPERVALITDSMEAAGLEEGEYVLGGQKVIVSGGAARLPGNVLAGSTLTQDKALRNVVSLGFSIEDGIKMLSETPATTIGVNDRKGKLEKGYDADFIVLDKELIVKDCYVKGTKSI